jgi:nitroreductase
MDVFEAIHSRRAIRTFTGKKIPKTDLERIVDAGRVAPSAVNRQMWDFVVVTEKETLDDILHHFHAGRKYQTYDDGKCDGISAIIAVFWMNLMSIGRRTALRLQKICYSPPQAWDAEVVGLRDKCVHMKSISKNCLLYQKKNVYF